MRFHESREVEAGLMGDVLRDNRLAFVERIGLRRPFIELYARFADDV